MRHSSLLIVLLLSCNPSIADGKTRIAVAANFKSTLDALIRQVPAALPEQYQISTGSSGLIYAQIINGAPFDLFLSADTERPRALLDHNIGVPGSYWVYARGRLALWAPKRTRPWNDLFNQYRGKLAQANPDFAPYGRAATQVLRTGLFSHQLQPVLGNNVAQTFNFILTGNSSLGFVSLAQLLDAGISTEKYRIPEPMLYDEIQQSLIVIKDTSGSRRLIAFMNSKAGQEIILEHGYTTGQLSSYDSN